MKLLVIGAGGREHALAWKLAQSPRVQKVFVAPGNGGTATETGVENLPLSRTAELIDFFRREHIYLTVVGPEAPLAEGIVDAFREASFIVMCDGTHVLPLATSQGHKRLRDGDTGPNTGGMGAYSPAPIVTPKIHARVMREIILPAVQGMIQDGHPYVGFLYAGLMIDAAGNPKTLEFNCRLGDPETQPILLRLKSDLLELIERALEGRLEAAAAERDRRCPLGR